MSEAEDPGQPTEPTLTLTVSVEDGEVTICVEHLPAKDAQVLIGWDGWVGSG